MITGLTLVRAAKTAILDHGGPLDTKAIANVLRIKPKRIERLLTAHGADFGIIQQPNGTWAIKQ